MVRGDHIYVERYYGLIRYIHHGIDCGDGKVIHYSGNDICKITLNDFSQGQKVYVQQHNNYDAPDIVIMRAESRIGECKYDLIFNNCEHFANWCKTGKYESRQVRQVMKPIRDLLDFFNWRIQDKERQYYKNLIDKQNEIIRKISYQLNNDNKYDFGNLEINLNLQQDNHQFRYQSNENHFIAHSDYTILENLLENCFWQEADELTFYLMLKIAKRENDRYFRPVDISNFPSKELLTIDKLWLTYSRNLFGFSVQKTIYHRLGGNRNYEHEIWEEFSNEVGWRRGDIPILYEHLCFNTNAPKGHLPHGNRIGSEIVGFLGII